MKDEGSWIVDLCGAASRTFRDILTRYTHTTHFILVAWNALAVTGQDAMSPLPKSLCSAHVGLFNNIRNFNLGVYILVPETWIFYLRAFRRETNHMHTYATAVTKK